MSSSGRKEGREEGQDFSASVAEEACKEVFGRTGGAGLPVFSNARDDSQINSVKRGLERAGTSAPNFHNLAKESCSEADVEVVEEEEKWGGGMYQQF